MMGLMSMREQIELGPCPADEEPSQVGDQDYHTKGPEECSRFISLIREVVGSEPPGAQLRVKSFEHDFGRYYECVVQFDPSNEQAVEYAFKCERGLPIKWRV